MFNEFVRYTQRFGVKKAWDPLYHNEAVIRFRDKNEIKTFFNNAMKDRISCAAIQRIAMDVAPSYCCRSLNNRRPPSDQELLEILFSEIDKGKANVVLRNDSLKSAHQQNEKENGDDKKLFENFDIRKFTERHVNHLKKIYSKMVHSDYHLIETVYHCNEKSTVAVPSIVETSSVKEHSTGWKDWDEPFDYGMFGVLKALIAFNLAKITRLSNSVFLSAGAGYLLEGAKCQYNMTGKSIIRRKWYGSFCIRFNLWTWSYELAWVKYNKSGPEERVLIELNRADRVIRNGKVSFEVKPKLIQPLTTMDEFLSNYKKGFSPPEHDVNNPVSLHKGLFGF